MAFALAGPTPFSALASAAASAVLMLTGSAYAPGGANSSMAASVGTHCLKEDLNDMWPPCLTKPGDAPGTGKTNNPKVSGGSRQSRQLPLLCTLCREL